MKRYLALIAVAAATFCGTLAGIGLAFDVRSDLYGEGVLLLGKKQGMECRDGGGCAVLSAREMNAIEQFIRANERKSRPSLGT